MKRIILNLFAVSSLAFSGSAATHYVNLNNLSPAVPYTNWVTAATNIQHAIDAAIAGDLIVVTNGVYQTGVWENWYGGFSRVSVNKPVIVQSVNGPAVTHIVGYQLPGTTNGPAAVRCAYLVNGATIAGFTLTNGATRPRYNQSQDTMASGGGVWCESASAIVSNCVLTGNSALQNGGGAYGGTLKNCVLTGNSAAYGGGAYSNNLENCVLTGNSASQSGGGAYRGTLINCTLTGNSALYGGGSASATLKNCIAYFNNAGKAGGNYQWTTLDYCCTTPLPPSGLGNIVAAPKLAKACPRRESPIRAGIFDASKLLRPPPLAVRAQNRSL